MFIDAVALVSSFLPLSLSLSIEIGASLPFSLCLGRGSCSDVPMRPTASCDVPWLLLSPSPSRDRER